jgi:hypothetical protein
VRLACIKQIVQRFQGNKQVFSLLCDRAINDVSPKSNELNIIINDQMLSVRAVAIDAIAKYWPKHPDTLPLLRERAENDPTPWLREHAKELIKQIAEKEE